MLTRGVPILASLNAEETIQFYTEKLGFRFHADWEGYLIFSKDDVQLHLWPTNDVTIPKNTGCYFNVKEVDALYELYKKANVIHPEGALKNMAWNMRQFSILDNNGNILHFGEELEETE